MFLRMVARPLMAKVKQTTGIKVPRDGVPSVRETLIGIYSQILNEIKKLPEHLIYRQDIVERANFNLKLLQVEEDMNFLQHRLLIDPYRGGVVERAHRELSEVSASVVDWICCHDRPPLSELLLKQKIEIMYDNSSSERELLIQLYDEALEVVSKVPQNNKLRMFAESSITRKLEVCLEEDDWESIKKKLDYEDPIEKAGEELEHWSLFFGPNAYPYRKFPHILRTKEFRERFDVWLEYAHQNHVIRSRESLVKY